MKTNMTIPRNGMINSLVHLLKARSRQNKSMLQFPRKSVKASMVASALFWGLILSSGVAQAGSVAGFGGSTEITQIMNNIQLVSQYEKQVQQFITQGQQYEAQLRNLEKNPMSIRSTDTDALIQNISRQMSASQAMGGSLSQIDRNFASKYNNTTAASYSDNFATWTNTSRDTLQGAMTSAGLRRDQYGSDTAALSALYDESQQSGGNLAAIQTLSKINIKQVEQMQGLSELMATQNIASSTFMASQNAKEAARLENNRNIMGTQIQPLPTRGTKNYLE